MTTLRGLLSYAVADFRSVSVDTDLRMIGARGSTVGERVQVGSLDAKSEKSLAVGLLRQQNNNRKQV